MSTMTMTGTDRRLESKALDAAQSPSAVRYAGFWRRFGAAVIDGILLSLAFTGLASLTGIDVFETVQGGLKTGEDVGVSFNVSLTPVGAVIWFGMTWLYFALLESSPWQATLGKLALRAKVTDAEGRRLGFGRATGRYFAKFLSTFSLGFGYLMVGVTAQKRGLHDIVAKTRVIVPASR